MPQPRRGSRTTDIWPGFVDALASLLMVVIFLLMVFVLAQFFLGQELTGRDAQLNRLNRELAELSDMLSLERSSNEDLREQVAQLSTEVTAARAGREEANARLAALSAEVAALERRRDQLEADLESERQARQEATRILASERTAADEAQAEIDARVAEIDDLRRTIAALEAARDELQDELSTVRAANTASEETIEGQLDEISRLQQLAENLRTARESLQDELEAERQRMAELGQELAEERDVTQASRAEVALLNEQVDRLRQEIQRLASALDAAEEEAQEQEATIANLGERLNQALASKVEELARYRSEFFGRLREAIGDRENIQIVGDRFVFQSEVLFDSGSSDLEPAGRAQIAKLAETLKGIAADIPDDLDWILRVDGHTDRRPISTDRFPNNWALSTARASAVVQYLIAQGLPPNRLAAAGFGEYQPIDPSNTGEAYRRNRRIEFKLTNR